MKIDETLPDLESFLTKFNIPSEDYKKTGLHWDGLILSKILLHFLF